MKMILLEKNQRARLIAAAALILLPGWAQAGPSEGQAIYGDFCAVCHGAMGGGETMGKPLVDSPARGLSDAELIEVISEGRSGTGMTAFKHSFDEQEIRDVAAYIRVLQGGTGLASENEENAGDEDPAVAAGRALFNGEAGCITCHTYGETGGSIGPVLDGVSQRLSKEELMEALLKPSAHIVAGYGVKELVTAEGERVKGRFRNDSELAIQILSEDGKRWVTYFKDRLSSIDDVNESLMPESFARLSASEQENILAFLRSL